MKTRLNRISPGDLGLLFGFTGFIVSIPIIVFALCTMGPGTTVTLKGFFSLTFKDSLEPIALILAYPFLNALAGLIGGFLVAWLYNFYARLFKGIAVDLQ